MQDRIERAGAQPIAVAAELVDHPLAEDGALCRVVQDVQPNEAVVQVAIFHRSSMSNIDIVHRV